jgi:hypothetical protein
LIAAVIAALGWAIGRLLTEAFSLDRRSRRGSADTSLYRNGSAVRS